MKKSPQLIIALDLPGHSEALNLAHSLRGTVDWLKVGLRLFISCGPKLISDLENMGFKVFLDLKFYDIPNTVYAAVREAARLGVSMLTIHTQGGKKMCVKAVEAANSFDPAPIIAAVTALTSFGPGEMPGIATEPGIFAMELAELARSWALNAIVCSPLEAAVIKRLHPGLLCICPGIRPKGSNNGDQQRIASPFDAVRAGADFLVVGRPVLEASKPVEAACAILREMQGAI